MANANLTETTWTPVIHYTDGRTVRLAGGLAHADALVAAEQAAADQPGVESTGATRD